LRVNKIAFESVRVRHDHRSRDFDIVIDDPHIGRFALTAAVPSLELRDEDSDWRQVTLDELKKILAEAAEQPQVSETAERESFNSLVAEGEHIMNAEIALFRAGICRDSVCVSHRCLRFGVPEAILPDCHRSTDLVQ
jgi:hypothetical protein